MKKNGYSLIELLIAMAFLAIIITPIYQTFISIGRNDYNTRLETLAYITASSILEDKDLFNKGIVEKDGFKVEIIKDNVNAADLSISSSVTGFTRIKVKVFWKDNDTGIVLSKVIKNG